MRNWLLLGLLFSTLVLEPLAHAGDFAFVFRKAEEAEKTEKKSETNKVPAPEFSFVVECPEKNANDTDNDRYKLCGQFLYSMGKNFEPVAFFRSRSAEYLNNVTTDLRYTLNIVTASICIVGILLLTSLVIGFFSLVNKKFSMGLPVSIAALVISIAASFGWMDQAKALIIAQSELLILRDKLELNIVSAKNTPHEKIYINYYLDEHAKIRRTLSNSISTSMSMPSIPSSFITQ